MDSEDYYGAPVDNDRMTLGERLRNTYDPEDFVTVQNIDTAPVTYQFTKPSDIETVSNYAGHKETFQNHLPKRVTLKPGQTKLCSAHEADLMIETLIKQMTMKKAEAEAIKDGIRFKTGDWTNPNTQKALIKEIYLGKEDVLGEYNRDLKQEVTKDLDEQPTAIKK